MALKYYSDSSNNLGLFDTITGAASIIGNTGRIFYDIAQSSSGQLFGIANEAGISKIYSINPDTGTSTFLWNVNSVFLNALANDASNNLYAAGTDGRLYSISSTGTVNNLGVIGNSAGDLVVVDNNVYLSNTLNQLVKFDLTTNQTSIVGKLPETIYGLATSDAGHLIATTPSGVVYDVNLTTGVSTKTGADVNIPATMYGVADATITNASATLNFDSLTKATLEYVNTPKLWFTDNVDNKIEVGESSYYGLGGSSKVIELEKDGGNPSNLYTMIDSVAGKYVVIDFDYSARNNFTTGTDSAIQVVVDGVVVATYNDSTVGFNHETLSVLGTGAQMRVEFKAVGNNGFGGLLDNIAITQQDTPPVVTAPTSASINFDNFLTGTYDFLAPSNGWNTNNTNGKVEVGTANIFGVNSTNKVIELEQNFGDAANLYRYINSEAGKVVNIQFDYSARLGATTGDNSAVQVLVNGQVIGTVNTHTVGFSAQAFSITGTGEPMRIEFKSVDSNGVGGMLDNISVTQSNIAVASTVQSVASMQTEVLMNFEYDTSTAAYSYNKPPTGWYTDNSSGQIETGKASNYGLVGNNKVFDLEPSGGVASNLYTIINSKIGHDVVITFDASATQWATGNNAAIQVIVDGKVIATVAPDIILFEQHVFAVPGTGSAMRVEFKSLDANAFGGVLDNISITQINVTNTAPVAANDSATGTQDADVVISAATLLSNDIDADGDVLSIFSVQDAVNGTVKMVGTDVIFTPNAGYSGPASFTYTVFDGKNGSDVATVNLTFEAVVAVNQAPIAKDDTADGFTNNQLVISPNTLLGNDTDPNGDPIHGVGLGNAVNGTVEWDGTNVIFTPTSGYAGPASFTYTIADDKGLESTATVNLTIVNNATAPNLINGTANADSIIGTTGDDTINGLTGDDKIQGGDGNDIITGGAGNDAMQGGAGADTFVWNLADTSATGVEMDTIYADGNDKLDMKDLLVGESNNANALDNYLHFSFEGGSTVVSVSSSGTFADNNTTGAITNGTVDQKIVLSGFDLTAGNTLSDVQVLQNLLDGKHLITD